MENQRWPGLASQFSALEENADFIAHRTPGGWLLHGLITQNAEFIALARSCLTLLGKTVASDGEVLDGWMERACTEIPGLEMYQRVDKTLVCRGINHLAATLCRLYQIKTDSRQMVTREETSYPDRAAWLQEILKAQGCSPHRFAVFSGIDRRTIKRVLAGRPVQETVLGRLATAANCLTQEIPAS